MKIAPAQSRQIKKLLTTIRKEGCKHAPPSDEDPLRLLLLGILSNYANEQRAAVAMNKVLTAFVDVNELRVTSVAEMVEIIGKDFPRVRPAAEEISQVLNSIFNRRHDLNLDFLRNQPKKPTEGFLSSLDGLRPHARAFFVQRYLRDHAVPLDEHMFAYLQKVGAVTANATVEDAQKMLASQIKDREGVNFYATFKRFAAVHGPRKLPDKRGAAVAVAPEDAGSSKTAAGKRAKSNAGAPTSREKSDKAVKPGRKSTEVASSSAGKSKSQPVKPKSGRSTSKSGKSGAASRG